MAASVHVMTELRMDLAGLMEAITIGQKECFEAALTFAKQVCS